MQFGDIFDENIDYYNWDHDNKNFPKIKTNESIIISFYKHKDYHSKEEPILIQIMKPLLEHQRITLLMFDFTSDIDKLYNYGINITTSRVIDAQLAKIPKGFVLDETRDFICSTGWISIDRFILTCQVKKDNENEQLISKAKDCVKGMKHFPHEENAFILKHCKYPSICQFTKKFLDYSAGDIFYTAIIGVDILICGEFEDVKERTKDKLKSYHEYREKYSDVRHFRQACYRRDKIALSLHQSFSKDSETSLIFSIYTNLKSTVNLLNKHPELLHDAITWLNDETTERIRQRYDFTGDILTDEKNVHLTNIKNKAYLACVQGLQKTPELISPFKDDDEKIKAEFNLNFGGGMKKKSDTKIWINITNSLTTPNSDSKTSSNAKNSHKGSKSAYNDEDYFASSFNNKSASLINSPWSNISMPKSPSSIDDSSKFSSTHPKNAKNAKYKSASNQLKNPSNCLSMKSEKTAQFNSNYPKLSNQIMNQLTYKQPTNKMVSFKPTQNSMTEITSNQKQQHETLEKPSKPINNVWFSVTQVLESQSGTQAKLPQPAKPPSGSQANTPPPAKPPQNDSNNQTNPYSKLSKNTN